MKKYPLILLITFFAAHLLFAQTRQLVVRGEAELKVAPDVAVLTIQVNAKAMEFSKAVSDLASREKDVLKKLEKIGYKKELIKTSDFSVYENKIWWEGRNYDSGYVARQVMALEFANSKEKLAEVINAFAVENTEVQIGFTFALSTELEQAKSDEVLQKAIADAKRKAELIAKPSEVTLGKALRIEYHVDQVGGNPMPMMDYRMEAKMASAGPSSGFEAKEITLSDGVVIYYEFE